MADNEEVKGKPKAENDDESQEEGKKTGGKKKTIIIAVIVAGVLVLQVGTAFLFVGFLKVADPSIEKQKQEQEEKRKAREKMTKIGAFLEEPIQMTVNIAGSKGEHYLKCSIQFEWDETTYPELRTRLTERQAKIKDIIIQILTEEPMEELKKSTGKQRIRETIISRVNSILPEEEKMGGQLNNIFFQEFIIQ